MELLIGRCETTINNCRLSIPEFWAKQFNGKCYCRTGSYISESYGKINIIVVHVMKEDSENKDGMLFRKGEYGDEMFEMEISSEFITIPKRYIDMCELGANGQVTLLGLGNCFSIAKDIIAVDKQEIEELDRILELIDL